MQDQKEFKVKESVLTALLQYLSTKPFGEVVELIKAIQQSVPVELKTESVTE